MDGGEAILGLEVVPRRQGIAVPFDTEVGWEVEVSHGPEVGLCAEPAPLPDVLLSVEHQPSCPLQFVEPLDRCPLRGQYVGDETHGDVVAGFVGLRAVVKAVAPDFSLAVEDDVSSGVPAVGSFPRTADYFEAKHILEAPGAHSLCADGGGGIVGHSLSP